MIIYVLKSNTACIEDYKLCINSPANCGRLDVVLDFILETLYVMDNIRYDCTIITILNGCKKPIVIKVYGSKLKRKIYSESEILKLLIDCIYFNNCIDGIEYEYQDFKSVVQELINEKVKLYYLHEKGKFIKNINLNVDNIGFIVGDQDGLLYEDEEYLDSLGIERISLSSLPYLSWYCSVIVNYYLDLLKSKFLKY